MTPLLSLEDLLAGSTILRTSCEPDRMAAPVHPWQLANGRFFFKVRSPQFAISARYALHRGAQFVILEDGDEEERALPAGAAYVIVENVNRAFARACSRLAGDVHRTLTLIGVTGADERTTVCHLIEGALRASGIRAGLSSSVVYRLPDSERPAPDAPSSALLLHNFLLELHRQRGTHAVIEISPADVADDRIFGLRFDALAFTGSGAGDVERLFTETGFHKSPSTLCAFNADDPIARELASVSAGRVVTFGFRDADVAPDSYSSDAAGLTLRLHGRELRSPSIGRRHAGNLLAAATVVARVLESEDAWLELGSVVPGSLERLPGPNDVDVFVFEAAPSSLTPESVEHALAAVREIAGSRRIVSLIACSGKSDPANRPRIARAAMNGADAGVFTIGDPGDEHPAAIVMAMLKGVPRVGSDRLKTVIHREAAIAAAIREALPDGIAVLIGTSAEDRQVAIHEMHELSATRRPAAAS